MKTTDQVLLNGLWKALNAPRLPGSAYRTRRRLEKTLKSGWLPNYELEDLFYDLDKRLADYESGIDQDKLIQAFDLRWRLITARPRRSSIEVIFTEAISVVETAYLLLELEALGFYTDGSVLLEALMPQVAKQKTLTDWELRLFWSKTMRGKYIRRMQSDAPAGRGAEIKTGKFANGYRYEVVLRADGSVFTLEVRGPKHRHKPELVETKCPDCGDTWYRGDPDSSREHRKTHKRRMAYLRPQPNPDMVAAMAEGGEFELVTAASPRWKQDQMYDRALAFKRELHYDFTQWSQTPEPGDDTNPHGFLFTGADGTIIGAASFRWRIWDDRPPFWGLQWIWVAPPHRREGVLAARWAMLRARFGDFWVESPVSEAMETFLTKQGDAHLMEVPGNR